MSTLSLNCFILGSDSSEVFAVVIPKTENVGILKRLIKEEQSQRLNRVDASKLTVWKGSVPVHAITPALKVDDIEKKCLKLHALQEISSIFVDGLVKERVHILVSVPGAFHKCFLNSS